ncbi:hypothetical protein MMC30_006916 [Trapelia coarctata]|nr:hypothetical protein [Trapelia coarctata]
MRLTLAALALVCFNTHILPTSAKTFHAIHARGLNDVTNLLGHTDYINTRVRRKADIALNHASYVQARQDTPPAPPPEDTASAPTMSASATSSAIAAPTVNAQMTAMGPDNTTDTACIKALSALNGNASSPSGMSICYNVLQFDNTTGNFQSMLGLYQVGAMTGDWVGVKPTDISIGVAFPGAMVAQENADPMKRDTLMARGWILRASAALKKRDAPMMMKDMLFAGQVDNPMSQFMNMTAMLIATMPMITLSSNAPNGTSLTSVLPNTEASFVTGTFMGMQLPSTTSAPAAAATTTPAGPFVYPGVTLGIFPVGLIITGIWTLLFISSIGLGTVGRLMIRTSYRKRQTGRSAGGKEGR